MTTPGEIFRVDPQQRRIVEHGRRDEGDAHRQRRVDARRQLLSPEQVFHQFFGSIGPHDFLGNADEIAQHPGPLGDRIDPPGKEVGDPRVGVRIAGRADVRPHTAGRAVAAHHIKELMGREMRQFIKAD
jgi:hypothetical protein